MVVEPGCPAAVVVTHSTQQSGSAKYQPTARKQWYLPPDRPAAVVFTLWPLASGGCFTRPSGISGSYPPAVRMW